MLKCINILEEYGPNIEYIPSEKNIAAYMLSSLPNDINQETTYESTYTTETMSELYNINEITYVMFTLSFKLVDHYQWKSKYYT